MKSPGCMRLSKQRGTVVVVLGITIAVLIGFAGLAIDLGRFFIIKSELQNAVDACALAAASQLRPGQHNASALQDAVAYGRVMATGGSDQIEAIRNLSNFQSEVVDIQAAQITFSDTLDGTYLDSASADYNTAAYARCTYPLSGLPVYFMQVLNPDNVSQTVTASAVATLAPSSSACAIPIGVCIPPGGGSPSNNFGLVEGTWLSAKTDAPYGTGNYGWVDFSPPGGGASELSNILMGSGQCALKIGDYVGEQGNKANLDEAWNSRFGWYKQGGGAPNLSNAMPDHAGYAYAKDTNWPDGRNAYAGTSPVPGAVNYLSALTSNTPYQGNTPAGIPGKNYTSSTVEQHASYGRNRRIVVAPILDCSVWNTSGNAQPRIEDWGCVLMLNPFVAATAKNGEVWDTPMVEFLGLTSNPGSPCVTSGEPGGVYGPLVPVMAQ